ncbi:hypothetical protein ACFFV7_38390 [Nonomuraea spiralis]|uniref:Uncharacterized protein n=1 Tax=Nonomuraea spiralis TaxID=46182 RepID=A0ABV5IRB5_9ACTN
MVIVAAVLALPAVFLAGETTISKPPDHGRAEELPVVAKGKCRVAFGQRTARHLS